MKKRIFIFIFILIIAFLFRIYGLNWDQSQHLHPDERFMTMVASAVSMPKSIGNYFDQNNSTLNPYNHNYNFYAYGTFPLLITRFLGELFNKTGYDDIFMVGRKLAVFFDLSTLFLVYKIAYLIFKKENISLWSMFFYAIAVFPIQQSHFFTVDSSTVFFSSLTMFLLLTYLDKKKWFNLFITGISFGLTLANKTSIGITLPVFILAIIFSKKILEKKFNLVKFFCQKGLLIFIFISGILLSFRLFQPYAFDSLFHFYPHWLENISEAHKMITGEIDYPPNIQWSYTKPLLNPLINIVLWGLGPIISILTLFGIGYSFYKRKDYCFKNILILLAFSGIIYIYQGIQLAKYMRYFYPFYPIMTIFAGFFTSYLINRCTKNSRLVFVFILIATSLIWPISFLSIYRQTHSRILASKWIYKNIPNGSKITTEEWDDGLPLIFPDYPFDYHQLPLGLYNTESKEKWENIISQLMQADYIAISSARLFTSIPRLPERYPVATLFYQQLFSEKLGFKKVAEFTSYPCFLNLCINDSSSEESFTVYDHPKILIFKKEKTFSPEMLTPFLDQKLINKAKNINPKDTNKIIFK